MAIGYFIANVIVMWAVLTFRFKNLFSIKDLYRIYLHKYNNLVGKRDTEFDNHSKITESSNFKSNIIADWSSHILLILMIVNFSFIVAYYFSIYVFKTEVDLLPTFYSNYGQVTFLILIMVSFLSFVFFAGNLIMYIGNYDTTKYTSTFAEYVIKKDLSKSFNNSVSDVTANFYVRGQVLTENLQFTTVCASIAELLIVSKDSRSMISSLTQVMSKTENISILAATLTLLNDDLALLYMVNEKDTSETSVDKAYTEKLQKILDDLEAVSENSEEELKSELIKNLGRGLGF